jgi:hypothetical protein
VDGDGAQEIAVVHGGTPGPGTPLLARFDGTLLAPNAMVFFGTGVGMTFTGSFFARVIEVRPDTSLVCGGSVPGSAFGSGKMFVDTVKFAEPALEFAESALLELSSRVE